MKRPITLGRVALALSLFALALSITGLAMLIAGHCDTSDAETIQSLLLEQVAPGVWDRVLSEDEVRLLHVRFRSSYPTQATFQGTRWTYERIPGPKLGEDVAKESVAGTLWVDP